MFDWLKNLGNSGKASISGLIPIVEKINSFENDFSSISDDGLKQKTQELKDRLTGGAAIDELLPESFALVREAGKRTLAGTLNLRAYVRRPQAN